MTVRIRETGELKTDNEFITWIRSADGGNTSIPNDRLTPEIMGQFGADPVLEGPQPTGEAWQHVESDGVEQVAGNWRTKWKLVPTFDTQEEQDTHVATWEAAALKAQTPSEISYGQFFTALWKDGERITYEEALAAVSTRTIPAELDGFLNMLASFDEAGARDARLLLSRATVFHRDNYLVPVFGSMYGMSETDIDALWRLGATL